MIKLGEKSRDKLSTIYYIYSCENHEFNAFFYSKIIILFFNKTYLKRNIPKNTHIKSILNCEFGS